MADRDQIAVVADSQQFYSAGVAAVLAHQFDFSTVLTATSLDELLSIAATRRIGLAVVADDLTGGNGPDTIRMLSSLYPDLRLAILSQRSDDHEILGMLAAGAHGVIARPNGDCRELIRGLATITKGGVFVPSMAEQDDHDAEHWLDSCAMAGLTERQQQCIQLLSNGHPNKVIARLLGISPSTVKVHVHAAFRALGVHSRLAAVAALRPRSLDSAARH